MSRFDDRFRAELTTILNATVYVRYPDHELTAHLYRYLGDARDDGYEQALLDIIVRAAEQLEVGRLASTSEFLATVALRTAHHLHETMCERDPTVAACDLDIRAVNDLVLVLAETLCNATLDGRSGADAPIFDGEVRHALMSTGSIDDERVRRLAHHLFCLTRRRGNARKLRPITPDRPIVQFNAAITNMPWTCYQEVKELTAAMEEMLSESYEIECTNEYANPLQPAPPNDLITRAGLYRSSALVVFLEHGGIGTGRTLEIADTCRIPVLPLQRVDANHPAGPLSQRFDGGISSQPVTYSTPSQAIEEIRKFLRVKDIAIFERAQMLSDLNALGPSHALKVVKGLKDAWPSASSLAHTHTLWWLENVHWKQAPAHVREAIIDLIAFVRGADGHHTENAAAHTSAMRLSRESLYAYKRKSGINHARVDQLWRAYVHRLADAPAHSSPRDATSSYDITDWQQLDERLD